MEEQASAGYLAMKKRDISRSMQVFSGTLAVVLLLLYAGLAFWMIFEIYEKACPIGEVCEDKKDPPDFSKFHAGVTYVVTTVGGLVSALVIAKLGATRPGEMPTFVGGEPVTDQGRFFNFIAVWAYLLTWVLVGLTCLVMGVIFYPSAIPTISDIGTVWLGLAVSAGYAYFGMEPPSPRTETLKDAVSLRSDTVKALEKHIENNKIKFDRASLKDELLGANSGTKITQNAQKLALHLADTVGTHIRISSIIRNSGHHGSGKGLDIGNEEIAAEILGEVVPLVSALEINEIIFDATVAGKQDRNHWNHDNGQPHTYDDATLDDHKDHVHFAVN